jgi:chaperonin GroES
VLVKKIERTAKTTTSGIIIPESAEEVTSVGEVILTGAGTTAAPMCVSVGNKVMYPPRAPQKVKIEEGEFFLLSMQDILLFW